MTQTAIESTSTDMPGIGGANHRTLVNKLDKFKISLPAIESWRELSKIPTAIREPRPPRFLDCTADELRQYVRREAINQSITLAPHYLAGQLFREIKGSLNYELVDAIRAGANVILDQLRQTFDHHANVMRQSVTAGIKANTSAEELLTASAKARSLWWECKNSAAQLDELLTVRQELSLVAGIPPATRTLSDDYFKKELQAGRQTTGIQWVDTVTAAGSESILQPYAPAAPWGRWLRIADALALAPVEGE